jgi:hypothetical protein
VIGLPTTTETGFKRGLVGTFQMSGHGMLNRLCAARIYQESHSRIRVATVAIGPSFVTARSSMPSPTALVSHSRATSRSPCRPLVGSFVRRWWTCSRDTTRRTTRSGIAAAASNSPISSRSRTHLSAAIGAVAALAMAIGAALLLRRTAAEGDRLEHEAR